MDFSVGKRCSGTALMKSDKVKASLTWIPATRAEGFTVGSRYTTVARFEDEKDKYPAEAWSLVIEFESLPDGSGTMLTSVRFLVEEAPSYLLHPGSKFELFEGRKLVASGEIIATPRS